MEHVDRGNKDPDPDLINSIYANEGVGANTSDQDKQKLANKREAAKLSNYLVENISNAAFDSKGVKLTADQKQQDMITVNNAIRDGKPLNEIKLVQVLKFGDVFPNTYKSLGRIEEVFAKIMVKLLNTLGISEDLKKEYQEKLHHHNLHAIHEIKTTVYESLQSRESHRNFQAEKDPESGLLNVPFHLFVEPKEIKTHGNKFVHKATADTAQKEKSHLGIEDLSVNGFDVKLVPKSFANVANKQIIPTSYILGTPETPDEAVFDGEKIIEPKDHLTNIYVLDLGPRQVVIRTGVIDTEVKKNDFVAIIKGIHSEYADDYKRDNDGKDLKLRIVSQQLNSFETESRMIQDQHYMITQANQELKELNIGEVIHINVPSNRWYHVTKKVLSLGWFGKIMKSIAPRNFLNGERLSKAVNRSAMGTYLNWVTADIDVQSNSDKQYQRLAANETKRIQYKAIIDAAVNEINSLKKEGISAKNHLLVVDQQKILKDKRKLLKDVLKDDYQTLRNLEKKLIGDLASDGEVYKNSESEDEAVFDRQPLELEARNEIERKYQLVSLMRQVLGAQLGNEGQSLDRGKEGMQIQMLNSKLGVVAALNCKSGLDRTGIWHAIKLALMSFENKLRSEVGPTKAFDLVNDWDKTSNTVNRISVAIDKWNAKNKNSKKPIRSVSDIFKVHDEKLEKINNNKYFTVKDREHLKKELNNKLKQTLELPEETTVKKLEIERQKIQDVIDFRNDVLNNLITIGIPITIASTGPAGLKWNTGHEENLIPLNFLPSHVMVNGNAVALVKYNDKGEPTGITKEGAQLLTKHQKLRGS